MRNRQESRSNSEDGFVLLAVLFLVALILIGLAVAAPKMAQEIRRDKETELYHRGQQYARAIRLYYRKTGNYPTDLSQLESTNNLRFLRKRYTDPITGKAFRLIHQGEAKSTLLGLFGQPIAGQIPGAYNPGTPIGSSPTGSTTQNGSLFGSNSPGSNGSLGNNGSFGNTGSLGSNGSFGGSSSFGSNGSQTGSSVGDPNNPGAGGTGSTGNPSGSAGSSGTGSGFGSSGSTGSTAIGGATVIGGRIVGVSSTSPKESIRVYKKQTHYNQWEFVYDPVSEGIVGGGQPGLNNPGALQPGLNNPGTTPTTPTGTLTPQSPPTTPTQPQ